jgi:hypothetical protein
LHIERRLDAGMDIATPDAERGGVGVADRLDRLGRTDPLDHARAVIALTERDPWPTSREAVDGPQRWLDALDTASDVHRSVVRHRSRELDRGIELSV